jgi:hypothetical protein
VAFARVVTDARRDGELVRQAQAASRDAEYGKQVAAAYLVEAAAVEHLAIWGLVEEESNDGG